MKGCFSIVFILCVTGSHAQWHESDTLLFSGQVSAWGNVNPDLELPVTLGGRFIPQLNYTLTQTSRNKADGEASLNISGSSGMHPFDSIAGDGKVKPYRLWARLSGRQYEVRLGLQKINFGSSSLLRPLMWFDQVDPRDPLQLTDGVWGLLGRYYFLNNANLWLWSLAGNKGPKTWEYGKTSLQFPEMGGRCQSPLLHGEAAVSYHFRKADTRLPIPDDEGDPDVPEHRLGVDGKWDLGAGVWFESSWIHKTRESGNLTNQEMVNVGMDYTFGWGNGVNMVFEHLWFSFDEDPFVFGNTRSFSGLSLSYPVGMNNYVSAIFYRDWTGKSQYNFVNWRRQYNHFLLYLMAFHNPESYRLPQQGAASRLFSGTGMQVMFVYNY